MANQIYITGQAIHDLASDPVWDMQEEPTFSETLITKYVDQLMTTGSCDLFEEDGEPMTNQEEARALVIETMTIDAELEA